MTWQPGGFLYLLSGNPGSHLLSAWAKETLDHDYLYQENHPLEVDYSEGQTLESFPRRREANCCQRASLPVMPCSGVVWNKLESHYDKRRVVIRFNGCIVTVVCVCGPDGDASNMQPLGGNYNNEQTVYLSSLVSSKQPPTRHKHKQYIQSVNTCSSLVSQWKGWISGALKLHGKWHLIKSHLYSSFRTCSVSVSQYLHPELAGGHV